MKVSVALSLLALLLPTSVLSAGAEPPEPSQVAIQGWAKSSFPALLAAKSVPESLVLGFVVNERSEVIGHSVAVQTGIQQPITQDLQQMFPTVSFHGSPMGGASCFNATAETPKYCVYWIMVPT